MLPSWGGTHVWDLLKNIVGYDAEPPPPPAEINVEIAVIVLPTPLMR